MMGARRCFLLAALGGILVSLLATDAQAQTFNWGGSIRFYQFLRTEDLFEIPFFRQRRDTEFSSLRLTLDAEIHPKVEVEAQAVLDFLSPPLSGSAGLAMGRGSTFLPLERDFTESSDVDLVGRFDRLNVRFNFDGARIVVGRQAISWGVTYFWPLLDLFTPFAPQRIDRDFKEGVDAIRVTVPLGDFSELEVVGAALGSSLSDDGALAAQVRFHLGRADVGLMGGKFHRDTVAAAYFTTEVRGAAVRGEVSWTLSGDPLERLIDRRAFWRATLGVDRQIATEVTASLEVSYNGYGVGDSSQYLLLALTDRLARGEVNALGTYYTGGAVNWKIHPLWTLSQAVLVNWQDPSALWIPTLEWSASDNASVLFGGQTGFGEGPGFLSLRSEYGAVETSLFAAVKWYF